MIFKAAARREACCMAEIIGLTMAARIRTIAASTSTSIHVKPLWRRWITTSIGKYAIRDRRGEQHAIVSIQLLEFRNEFTRFGRFLEMNEIEELGHHAGLD